MRTLSSLTPRLLTLVFILAFVAGCASTPIVVEEEVAPPPAPTSPLDGFTAIVADETGVAVQRGADRGQSFDATGSIAFVSSAPDGSAVVLARGGFLIGVARQDGMVNILSSGSADRVYTGAWSQDGMRFHFGFYRPVDGGMGEGGINTWDRASDEVRAVGCSASKAVLAELPSGSLLVRNTDNLYEVEAEGCGTVRSVDARKLHHVSPSPDGQYLAYILRDLVYNREERSYEPDSTLYIESAAGSDPVKVIGDKYAPRNLMWRPDGSELLYDVAPPDDAAQRAVSIYTLSDARSSYLLPPSSSTAATHGRMSPGGQHVLYRQTMDDGAVDWQVKTAGSNFSQSLPIPAESIQDIRWVNADHLIVGTAQTSFLVSVAGSSPQSTDLDTTVVWLW